MRVRKTSQICVSPYGFVSVFLLFVTVRVYLKLKTILV